MYVSTMGPSQRRTSARHNRYRRVTVGVEGRVDDCVDRWVDIVLNVVLDIERHRWVGVVSIRAERRCAINIGGRRRFAVVVHWST